MKPVDKEKSVYTHPSTIDESFQAKISPQNTVYRKRKKQRTYILKAVVLDIVRR